MYNVIFYRESSGKIPVLEYIEKLAASKSKDDRVKLHKIQDYIKALGQYGTMAGLPYVKHLDGDIWELRPIRDRILFAGVVGGQYVLLHSFVKKTQKTPSCEIEKAKREFADFKERSELYEYN